MLTTGSQRGFYLLEAIVVMSVAISMMSLGARYITDSAERSVNQVTAQQLKQVTQAAQQYVQDHYQAFNDNPNHPLEWQTLVDQGYLSDKVLNHNHYGQAYHFEVKNANGQLQLILTTRAGQPISESSMRQVAALAGSSTGYATTLHKNRIVGNQEGWFLEGVPLATGHLASLSIVNEKEIMDAANFLRRTKFKDHEEYNQMETDLEIAKNNKIWFGPEGIDDTTELSAQKFLMGNRGNDWTTEIKPAEIRLESKSSGNKSYVGNDKLIYENATTKKVQINSQGISVMGGENDIIVTEDYINSWSKKTSIQANWLALPVYWYKTGQFNDGSAAAKKLCQSIHDPFAAYPDGRMFLVRENLRSNYSIFVCIANYLVARIETKSILLD